MELCHWIILSLQVDKCTEPGFVTLRNVKSPVLPCRDLDQTTRLEGTVKEFQWTNPHAWIMLTVAKQGEPDQEWAIEMGVPAVWRGRAGSAGGIGQAKRASPRRMTAGAFAWIGRRGADRGLDQCVN
jgi:hypothetical protein